MLDYVQQVGRSVSKTSEKLWKGLLIALYYQSSMGLVPSVTPSTAKKSSRSTAAVVAGSAAPDFASNSTVSVSPGFSAYSEGVPSKSPKVSLASSPEIKISSTPEKAPNRHSGQATRKGRKSREAALKAKKAGFFKPLTTEETAAKAEEEPTNFNSDTLHSKVRVSPGLSTTLTAEECAKLVASTFNRTMQIFPRVREYLPRLFKPESSLPVSVTCTTRKEITNAAVSLYRNLGLPLETANGSYNLTTKNLELPFDGKDDFHTMGTVAHEAWHARNHALRYSLLCPDDAMIKDHIALPWYPAFSEEKRIEFEAALQEAYDNISKFENLLRQGETSPQLAQFKLALAYYNPKPHTFTLSEMSYKNEFKKFGITYRSTFPIAYPGLNYVMLVLNMEKDVSGKYTVTVKYPDPALGFVMDVQQKRRVLDVMFPIPPIQFLSKERYRKDEKLRLAVLKLVEQDANLVEMASRSLLEIIAPSLLAIHDGNDQRCFQEHRVQPR